MLKVTDNLTYDLLLVLALFSVFAWCVRRGIVGAREVLWLGTAMSFFAVSLVFNATLSKNIPIYGHQTGKLLEMTALMMVPLALALIYGIYALHRTLLEKELAAVDIGGMTVRLVLGNIATLKPEGALDALICPANTNLRMGWGVSGALRAFGGAEIEREAQAQGPIEMGQAIATGAGRLNVTSIIHAAVMGPTGRTDVGKVKRGLEAALKCARRISARRVALPAFGTGIGALRASVAAPLILAAVVRARKDFDEIWIVVLDRRTAPAFAAEFAALAEKYPAAGEGLPA